LEQVFVDTAAWIALLNTSDRLHRQAQGVMRELEQERAHLVTTELVLIEVADSLAAAAIRAKTVAFVERLRQLPILRIIPAQQQLLAAAWTLYRQRADKDWGLTDCSSFVVMTEEQIVRAFTSDRHFQQAGFTALMSFT